MATLTNMNRTARNAAILILFAIGILTLIVKESKNRSVSQWFQPPPVTVARSTPAPSVAAPSATPLPPHFPTTEGADLGKSRHVADEIPIEKVLATCWKRTDLEEPAAPEANLTVAEVTRLFGRLKKQEVIETTESGRKLGLILEPEIFKSGAAGTAVEKAATAESPAVLTDLQLRADGQLLHCRSALECRCL